MHRYLFPLTAVVIANLLNPATVIAVDVPTNPVGTSAVIAPVNSEDAMSQVTSVSQLSDVKPSDWAFQALRSLVERYGCIAGYGDQTYRGNRTLTRYEFAASLNACLNQVNELVAARTTDLVRQEDVAVLQQLQNEFATELATLRGRVDVLEAHTASLETHQFSPTTRLVGQVIMAASGVSGSRVGTNFHDAQIYFADRGRLNLESSFSGEDFLRVRLEFGNFLNANSSNIAAVTGTNLTRLNFDTDNNNELTVPHLLYRFPISATATFTVGPVGIGFTDITETVTPPTIADDGRGIPSLFGEYSPFYRQGGGGGAVNWHITKKLLVTAGYLAFNPNDPTLKNGFNGGYNAMTQLQYQGKRGQIGLAYAHLYAPRGKGAIVGGTGSFLANQPFGENIAQSSDTFNVSGFYHLSPNFDLHAWGGYVSGRAEVSGFSDIANSRGGTNSLFVGKGNQADIFYGAIGLTFPDVGGKGNLPGLLFGIPPKVFSSDVRHERDTAYHIETFYRWQVNDNVGITPGFWVDINPENNSKNDPQLVGVLRTYFSF